MHAHSPRQPDDLSDVEDRLSRWRPGAEGLDPDAARWLSSTIETKRDRGAAVILASHYLQDLAGVCDAYLFLVGSPPTVLHAHEISPVGPVTSALLTDVYDRLRGGPATHRLHRGVQTA